MTTKEITTIVTQNSLAIAENTTAIAANNKAIAQLTNNILSLHDSVKSLEVTALAHDAQIDQLIESGKKLHKDIVELKRHVQAYLTTRNN